MSKIFVNPNKINNLCAGIITAIISYPVNITAESGERLDGKYSIGSARFDTYSARTDLDRLVKVVPIGKLWLNFSIEFSIIDTGARNPNYGLKAASITIFKGMAYDPDKEILFRAEWDNNAINDYNHPQPHWHVHFAQRVMSDNVKKNFDEILAVLDDTEKGGFLEAVDRDDVEPEKEFSLSKFHFAMNAYWDKSGGSTRRTLDETNLINWVEGCLNHIKQQIEYCSK